MKNTIINKDCLEALKSIPDNSVDLVAFSPPYDSIRDYGKDWIFNYSSLGEELFRVTKDGGVCVVVIQDGTKNFTKSLTSFKLAVDWCDNRGWKLFECCIYSREGRPGAWWSKRFRVDHEYILIFFKGDSPKFFNKEPLKIPCKHKGKICRSSTRGTTDGSYLEGNEFLVSDTKCCGTIWPYTSSSSEGNKTKLIHPATYPDKLAKDLIECFTQPNDLVLDPMCGSGTTCVMARNLGRNFIGIEINTDYINICNLRLKNETSTKLDLDF